MLNIIEKDINEKLLEAEIEMNTNSKRYTIEEVQIHDGNPYNDKVRHI